MSTAHAGWISPEEYLAAGQVAETKHEYLDGQVWAMTGAVDRHVTITTNLVAALRPLLRGGPCRLYSTDMRVYPTAAAYFYPDVMVCCDERDRANRLAKQYPARAYRSNGTLLEYALVATDRSSVDLYRRESGFWVLRESGPGETIGLSSIGATLDMAAVYKDVDWSGADEEDLAP